MMITVVRSANLRKVEFHIYEDNSKYAGDSTIDIELFRSLTTQPYSVRISRKFKSATQPDEVFSICSLGGLQRLLLGCAAALNEHTRTERETAAYLQSMEETQI